MVEQVVEANTEEFQKLLTEKETKIAEAEKKYLSRLAKEAKDAGVDMKEDDLLSIGEKGIIALIEQAKKIKPVEKADKKEEKAQSKGIVIDQPVELYEPEWTKGPIMAIQKEGKLEIWQNWDYDYFRGN